MSDGEELSGVGRTSGARNAETRALMEAAIRSGNCPFCSPYFEEMNADRVIELEEEPRYWHVFHNSGPIFGAGFHIVLAPKSHAVVSTQLDDYELAEKQAIIESLQEKFGYVSFTELSRQGDMRFNSATVEHLHYHIIVSSGESADASLIPARHLSLIEEVFRHIEKFAAESGGDPLEHLDRFREYTDLYREAKRGKAIPIRVKLSNRVGTNSVDQSP